MNKNHISLSELQSGTTTKGTWSGACALPMVIQTDFVKESNYTKNTSSMSQRVGSFGGKQTVKLIGLS